MSQDGRTTDEDVSHATDKQTKVEAGRKQWFTTPPSIKRLFDKFPLRTYQPNELPQRGTPDGTHHLLYIFTTQNGAGLGSPSFNPGCLKWQAYLKFTGIQFSTISSNNHASPTGALPFLIPSLATAAYDKRIPVPSTKLHRWALTQISSGRKEAQHPHSREPFVANKEAALDQGGSRAKNGAQQNHHVESNGEVRPRHEPSDMRYDAYLSLLDNRIRNAWLYFLYLEPSNFAAVAYPLYITPCSSNSLVRASLAYSLRVAAKTELLKQLAVIDVDGLYRECNKAFSALSQLLGDDQYFFAADRPGLFDASVFAYTNPLLDDDLAWQETRMLRGLKVHENLVEHRKRILKRYF